MTDCKTCGEETTFWKRCKPRKTRASGYKKTKQTIWYKCSHCGHTQYDDRTVI